MGMQTQFQFQPIATQVAASICKEINAGEIQTLPSERKLALQLQVSRRTIRKALLILRAGGFVKTEGRRTFSARPREGRTPENKRIRVNILLPEPLAQARPFTALWINSLGELLHKNGYQPEIISGQKYYGIRSGRSLSNLVSVNPAHCWVLTRSNHPLQKWFNDQGVPAIVAGSTYPSITLPSVDTDHAALSHHAAAAFLRQGHVRLALFFEKLLHAGDLETEKGFRAGLSGNSNAREPIISRVERTPEAVVRELQRMLSLPCPPTGFLFCNAFAYLTAQGYLASLGYLVPRDFSMISQDEGPFLAHVYPAPARYVTNATKFATAVNRVIKHMLEEHTREGCKVRIMPDFISGASVGPMKEIAPKTQMTKRS
jgi:LacI family transcriptional regulator